VSGLGSAFHLSFIGFVVSCEEQRYMYISTGKQAIFFPLLMSRHFLILGFDG